MDTQQTGISPLVQTRQVSIQVLTIGARQVTQTMYRQFPTKSIFDSRSGNLLGDIWGWVNLHLDCTEPTDHYHIIWAQDGKLYKDTIGLRIFDRVNQKIAEKIADIVEVYAAIVAFDRCEYNYDLNREHYFNGLRHISLDIRGCTLILPIKLKSLYSLLTTLLEEDEYIKAKNEVYTSYKQKIRTHDLEDKDPFEITDEAEKLIDRQKSLKSSQPQCLQYTESAGQLFIAVSGVWK